MATEQSKPRAPRPFGVRLYLALAFAAVALITAGLSVLLVSASGEDTAGERAEEITVGRSVRLADRIGDRAPQAATTLLTDVTDPGYAAWVFDRRGELLTPDLSRGIELEDVPGYRRALRMAQRGSRTVEELPGEITRLATPIFREGRPAGALLARAETPEEIQAALEEIRGDRLTAALIALLIAVVIGFLIASAISTRVKRLARSAARMTEGDLQEPLEGTGGRDEITDLGGALETMRRALQDTFSALSSERDRLSAIFDALDDAVIVVGPEGEARFANSAAEDDDLGRRPGDQRAPALAAARRRAWRRGARRAARRRPRVRGRGAQAPGRGRGAGRGPRPHRGAPPRDRRARVRVQRRARAAQPDRRASRERSRCCAAAPRTTPTRASIS